MFVSTFTYQMLAVFPKMHSSCCGYLLNSQHLFFLCIAFISTIFGILFGYMRIFGNVLIGLTFDLLITLFLTMYLVYPYHVSTKYNDTIGLISLYSTKYGLINGINVEAIVSIDIPIVFLITMDIIVAFLIVMDILVIIWILLIPNMVSINSSLIVAKNIWIHMI